MTTKYRAVVYSLSLLLVSLSAGLAADSTPSPVAERIAPERVELKVLKVFAAKDGDAIFRAYLVKWKDQEIVVSDTLAKSNYKEGDTISVLVINNPFPQGKEPYRLLAFSTVPPMRAR